MTDRLTEDEYRRLRDILEHEGLQAFLPYAEMAAAEAKLSSARRLVWKTYRQMFITGVAVIVAIATFWEKFTAVVRALVMGTGAQ